MPSKTHASLAMLFFALDPHRKRGGNLAQMHELLLKISGHGGMGTLQHYRPAKSSDMYSGLRRFNAKRKPLSVRFSTSVMQAGNQLPPALPGADLYSRGSLDCAIPAWWRQTADKFQVVCELPNDVSVKRSVCVDITRKRLSVSIGGESIVDGKLPRDIVDDESEWYVDDCLEGFGDSERYLVVDLRKKSDVDWDGPLESAVKVSRLSLSPHALATLDADSVVVLPDFVSSDAIAALNRDHLNLRTNGHGEKSMAGQGRGSESHRNSWQINLPSNGALPDRADDSWAAKFLATEFIPNLMTQLAPLSSRKDNILGDFVDVAELYYLHYPPGGFFRMHLDMPANTTGMIGHDFASRNRHQTSKRAFSFVLFLNDLDESQGGALRLYHPMPDAVMQQAESMESEEYEAILQSRPFLTSVRPAAGTLVIFRSEAISHQVVDTYANRDTLVGWFHRPLRRT